MTTDEVNTGDSQDLPGDTKLRRGELRALAEVLSNALSPRWLPIRCRAMFRPPFKMILRVVQTWGALVYIPGRAVAVLTPPRNRPRFVRNELTKLGRTHWRLSNCGAWPTGSGAGALLLTCVCGLADCAGLYLCLRASNGDNQRFYERFGFERTSASLRGMTMVRLPRATGVSVRWSTGSMRVMISGRRCQALISPRE